MSSFEPFSTPILTVCLDESQPLLGIVVDPRKTDHVEVDPGFQDTVEQLVRGKVLIPIDDNAWNIDLRPIGRLRHERVEQYELRKLNTFLAGLLIMPYLLEDDSALLAAAVGHYSGINSTGRLAIACEVRWPIPSVDDTTLTSLGSRVMVRAAQELGYADMNKSPQKRERGRGLVYAHVDRQRGVVLETNEMGSCSMGTDGSWFRPEEETFEISSHNIYGIDQQVICLAGAITVANANELLERG